MVFRPGYLRDFLERRGDVSEEERTVIFSEWERIFLTRSIDDETSLDTAELDRLLVFRRDLAQEFMNRLFCYLTTRDLKHLLVLNGHSEPVMNVRRRSGEKAAERPFYVLSKDRGDHLLDLSLAREVPSIPDERILSIPDAGDGLNFSMPIPSRGFSALDFHSEWEKRLVTPEDKWPLVVLLNGMSSVMEAQPTADIRRMFHGLGVPVASIECRPAKEADGSFKLHSFADLLAFAERSMECIFAEAGDCIDPERVAFVGHSRGGAVAHDLIPRVLDRVIDPILARVATPFPFARHFPEGFGGHHALFTGSGERVAERYLRAMEPSGEVELPDSVRETYVYHRRDLFVRNGLYRKVEPRMTMVFDIGQPFSQDKPADFERWQKLLIEARKYSRQVHRELLGELLKYHNFVPEKDRHLMLTYLLRTLLPHLMRPEFLSVKYNYLREDSPNGSRVEVSPV